MDIFINSLGQNSTSGIEQSLQSSLDSLQEIEGLQKKIQWYLTEIEKKQPRKSALLELLSEEEI